MLREFQDKVRGWIAEALGEKRDASFGELVNTLPGVHPNDVAKELKYLGVNQLSSTKRQMNSAVVKQKVQLPIPHPLDYDWRFTEESCGLLLQQIEKIAAHADSQVVFLGTPTLFRAVQDTSLAKRSFLIDASQEICSALQSKDITRVFSIDLLVDELPAINAAIIVADPPWYEEFTQAFLWASSRIALSGGIVLFSTPPVGTRPGVEQEWERVVAFAKKCGLELRDLNQCLKYASPPFEKNALRIADHPYVDSEWRPGILARFEKIRDLQVARPIVSSERVEWMEQSASGIRFRLRKKMPVAARNPVLVPLTHGEILASVSRRDPTRPLVDVWTSGNRVFACADTGTLQWIIQAIQSGDQVDTFIEKLIMRRLSSDERILVKQAEEQVSAVIEHEQEEYALKWEG